MDDMGTLTGSTVFITGGNGFIGSHVTEQLLAHRCRVIVSSIEHDPSSYFYTRHLDAKAHTVFADVTDYERISSIIASRDVEYVIHFAAQPLVEAAYHNPRETFLTNIMGTVNVLEACRHCPRVKGILIASSDKAYGKKQTPYLEHDALRGDHPYESSKSSADLIAQTYANTYHMPVVITRFGNVYGPGDVNWNRIVPGAMAAILTNTPLTIRSDGTYVRDYCFVDDIAEATIALLEHIDTTAGQAFNISTDDTFSVTDLIKKIERVLRVSIMCHITNTAQNEIPRQSLSYERITQATGWKPSHTIEKGLRETFAWYTRHASFTQSGRR